MLSPIFGERALSFDTPQGHILLLTDVHIGLTTDLSLKGINAPSQISTLIETGQKLCERAHPDKIILLGDIKHVIPRTSINPKEYQLSIARERDEVVTFLDALRTYAPIEIIPGNHDGNIRKIIPKYPIHPSSGLLIRGNSETVGIIHGHAWPAQEIMQCEYLVMGHIHPTVQIRDYLGQSRSYPCWVKGTISQRKAEKRYGNAHPHLIVIPAFNPLCGGIPITREGFVGPLGTIVDQNQARVYLLNGTNLGQVKNLR